MQQDEGTDPLHNWDRLPSCWEYCSISRCSSTHNDDSATPQINRKFHPRLLHRVRAFTKDLEKKKVFPVIQCAVHPQQQQPSEQVGGGRRSERGGRKVPASSSAGTRGRRAAAERPDSCWPAAGGRRSGPAGRTGSCGAAGAPGGTARLGSASQLQGGEKVDGVRQSDLRGMQTWRKAARL